MGMYASWMDVLFLTNTLSDLSLVSSVALLSALVSSLLSYKNKVETKTWKRFIFARKFCSLKIKQWRPSKKQCIFSYKRTAFPLLYQSDEHSKGRVFFSLFSNESGPVVWHFSLRMPCRLSDLMRLPSLPPWCHCFQISVGWPRFPDYFDMN